MIVLPRAGDSSHQCHELAAAGDFEFVEDRVKMLFDRWQTQASLIGDLLVAPPVANQSRDFLFARGEPGEMRQTGGCCLGMLSSVTAQGFALDEKMRPRQIG